MSLEDDVRYIKELHKESLLTKPNVIGVGTGYKKARGQETTQPCVIALVSQKIPKAALVETALVPRELDGVITDVIEIGFPRAQQSRQAKWRPAPGGVTVGHFLVTAGTMGCVVKAVDTDQRLILSNNHVLANMNNCKIGDAILQPGTANGGTVQNDTIATLERYVPLDFGTQPAKCMVARGVADFLNELAKVFGSSHRLISSQQNEKAINYVDAAAARPLDDYLISDEILEIGTVNGVRPVTFGMTVRKSGRTTGLTTGNIIVLNATITIDYRAGITARFEDQVITTPMSTYGDSGSLIVAGDSLQAVGLLFAGSDQATIFNPIQSVMQRLKVTI
jgi:hypothetical protein